jgi:hypothetical protein
VTAVEKRASLFPKSAGGVERSIRIASANTDANAGIAWVLPGKITIPLFARGFEEVRVVPVKSASQAIDQSRIFGLLCPEVWVHRGIEKQISHPAATVKDAKSGACLRIIAFDLRQLSLVETLFCERAG